MPNVYTVQVCSLKTTTVKNWFDAKNVQSGHTQFVRTIGKGLLSVTGVRNDRHLLLKTLLCNINKYNFLFLASLNCFRALNVRNPWHPIIKATPY